MRVLMAGASGFIGRSLALRLRQHGYALRAWARDRARAESRLGGEVDVVTGALEEAVEGCDAVVNLAGDPILGGRWTARKRAALETSRIELTERLVSAIGRASAPPRVLVSASAVGYYGDRAAESLIEGSAKGTGYLSDLCAAWEATAQKAKASGVRVVLPRIGVVLGLEGGALGAMLPPFRLGLGGPIGSGDQFFPWIHIEDIVEILCRAIVDESLEGPVNAVAPEAIRQRDFAKALGRALRRPAVARVPAPLLRAALGEAASVLLSSQRVHPARLEGAGFQFRYARIDDALQDLLSSTSSVRIERAETWPNSPYFEERKPRYRLSQETVLDAALEEVFAFFSKAENLGAMTPSALAFEIQTPRPIEMRAGARIEYRIGLMGVPMTWRAEIEQWTPGERFVDVQRSGPYHAWWHEHQFERRGGRTVMTDTVYYAPPFGAVGAIGQHLLVAPMLRRIFGYRAAATRFRFGQKARLTPSGASSINPVWAQVPIVSGAGRWNEVESSSSQKTR